MNYPSSSKVHVDAFITGDFEVTATMHSPSNITLRLESHDFSRCVTLFLSPEIMPALKHGVMMADHFMAYGDEHDENCPLCGVDAQP